MSDSIREQIVQNIVTTLGGITTGGGYANTVASVTRPNPGLGKEFSDLTLVVHQGDPDPQPGNIQLGREWVLPVQIICPVEESTTSSTPIDARLNSIAADVEKILMVDTHRSSLAIRTEIGPQDYAPIEPDAHIGAVTININIHYRTRWNDPYTIQ